jgi:hypothetical protein
MTTTTRTCDAPGCGLVATLAAAGTPGLFVVTWPDGTTEHLRGLPPDGSIRCLPHRPGSRYSHPCRHGFVHSTTEAAFACAGHGEAGQSPEAFGLYVRGDGT